MDALRRLHTFWFGAVPAARLDRFRRAFALTAVAYFAYRFLHADEWLTSEGFHSTLFPYQIFGRQLLLVMPAGFVPLFGAALFGSASAVALGWRPRLFCALLLPLLVYAQVVDFYSSFSINRLYVAGFAILAAARAPQRDAAGREVQSAWPLRTLQATLLTIYFEAAVGKAFHGDWLETPDALWSQAQGLYRTDLAAGLLRVAPRELWTALQFGTLFFEATAPLTLALRRLRPFGMAAGLGLHLGIAATMHALVFFSAQILSFYLLFLPLPRRSPPLTGASGIAEARGEEASP